MSGASAQAADAMVADIDEIDAIIGQFLDFARGADEEKKEQDLAGVLGDLAEHYGRLGKAVNFQHEDIKPFRFARMAVRRAVANLIDNALRYAGEPVELEVFEHADRLVIEVRDRGPGIPAGEVERLKRPFTRLDTSRAGAAGAGLGLAIVERTAQAHGGGLALLPREPRGLTARLTLARG
jgi:two-component system osmolarity sensor histidine kinase EnvZ